MHPERMFGVKVHLLLFSYLAIANGGFVFFPGPSVGPHPPEHISSHNNHYDHFDHGEQQPAFRWGRSFPDESASNQYDHEKSVSSYSHVNAAVSEYSVNEHVRSIVPDFSDYKTWKELNRNSEHTGKSSSSSVLDASTSLYTGSPLHQDFNSIAGKLVANEVHMLDEFDNNMEKIISAEHQENVERTNNYNDVRNKKTSTNNKHSKLRNHILKLPAIFREDTEKLERTDSRQTVQQIGIHPPIGAQNTYEIRSSQSSAYADSSKIVISIPYFRRMKLVHDPLEITSQQNIQLVLNSDITPKTLTDDSAGKRSVFNIHIIPELAPSDTDYVLPASKEAAVVSSGRQRSTDSYDKIQSEEEQDSIIPENTIDESYPVPIPLENQAATVRNRALQSAIRAEHHLRIANPQRVSLKDLLEASWRTGVADSARHTSLTRDDRFHGNIVAKQQNAEDQLDLRTVPATDVYFLPVQQLSLLANDQNGSEFNGSRVESEIISDRQNTDLDHSESDFVLSSQNNNQLLQHPSNRSQFSPTELKSTLAADRISPVTNGSVSLSDGELSLIGNIERCPHLYDDATLECRVKRATNQNWPVQRFRWSRRLFGESEEVKNGPLLANQVQMLANDDRTRIDQVTAAHQRLTVSRITPADTGVYTCHVTFQSGHTAQLQLLVFLCH